MPQKPTRVEEETVFPWSSPSQAQVVSKGRKICMADYGLFQSQSRLFAKKGTIQPPLQ